MGHGRESTPGSRPQAAHELLAEATVAERRDRDDDVALRDVRVVGSHAAATGRDVDRPAADRRPARSRRRHPPARTPRRRRCRASPGKQAVRIPPRTQVRDDARGEVAAVDGDRRRPPTDVRREVGVRRGLGERVAELRLPVTGTPSTSAGRIERRVRRGRARRPGSRRHRWQGRSTVRRVDGVSGDGRGSRGAAGGWAAPTGSSEPQAAQNEREGHGADGRRGPTRPQASSRRRTGNRSSGAATRTRAAPRTPGVGGAGRVRPRPDRRVGLDRREAARREVVADRRRRASPPAPAGVPPAVVAMQVMTAGSGASGQRADTARGCGCARG